jgi:hypothetical protein
MSEQDSTKNPSYGELNDRTEDSELDERMYMQPNYEQQYEYKWIPSTDGRIGLNDDEVSTKLLDKNFSPMIIRKYTRIGFPLYVHIICDQNLDDLDTIVHDCIDMCRKDGILKNNIQSLRNFTGVLSDYINNHYDNIKRGCVESLGIIFYADKILISSLSGDAMNHFSCREELYQCLNLMAKI